MAGQGIERRELLRIVGTASVAAGFAGFSKWAFACEPVHAAAKGVEQIKSATYTPQFFFADEYPVVVRLSEMIIPVTTDRARVRRAWPNSSTSWRFTMTSCSIRSAWA